MNRRNSMTADRIFANMHRDLRAWNSEIPESPERLDPILRIMLEMYAHQLADIDSEIGKTWDVASASLIKSLSPECRRWPVPAYTVMQCEPLDPMVEVDPHTRVFYKEKREGGQTFFFSTIRSEKILKASVKHLFLKFDQTIVDLSPKEKGASPASAMTTGIIQSLSGAGQAYAAIEFEGQTSNLADALVFMKGSNEALAQLRWSTWYPGSNFGSFYQDSGFCPGLTSDLDTIFPSAKSVLDWGGFRRSSDIFKALENSFVQLPEQFTITWEPGPIDPELSPLLKNNGIDLESVSGSYYWVRMDLPINGDRSRLAAGFELHLDSMLVVNKNELRLFKHTGGSPLVEIELPEHISTILELTEVVDSHGDKYVATHEATPDGPRKFYSVEDRDDHMVLWFDFSNALDRPPDSITVTYAATAGISANGISAGKIAELYESHPGLNSVVNLIPTAGAIPSKSEEQIVSEASARLRDRDRALSFEEIARWAKTFDPRIEQAVCENGVEKFERGVRRCIVVRIATTPEGFHSDDELDLLRHRLAGFLKARSPVNTRFLVKMMSL